MCDLTNSMQSYFFKNTEMPFRLAVFWMANRLTDVVAPLLAYGLLRLRGLHGREGWYEDAPQHMSTSLT
jgi:hypothetical protein